MKQPVKISAYSMMVSIIGLLIVSGIAIYLFRNGNIWQFYIMCAVMAVLCIGALIYMPVSISIEDKALCVNRLFLTKKIPVEDIAFIEMMSPTMGEKRVFASGGWFGYWGWFYERDLGKYFGYYGKASDCFLVRLKDGSKYMLGCSNPSSIINSINKL